MCVKRTILFSTITPSAAPHQQKYPSISNVVKHTRLEQFSPKEQILWLPDRFSEDLIFRRLDDLLNGATYFRGTMC